MGALFALFFVLWIGAWIAQLPFLVLTRRWPSVGPVLFSIMPTLILCWQWHLILDRLFPLFSLDEFMMMRLLRVAVCAGGGLTFIHCHRHLIAPQEQSSSITTKGVVYLHASVLTALALWVFGYGVLFGFTEHRLSLPPPVERPHIILLSTDGIESRSMSLYGSEFDTTPFWSEMAKESVVYNNAFSNAGKTTGSVTSMLSGVHPLANKVMFPPQILTGQHAYLHLPGLLRSWGYRGYQGSIRFYADAEDLNMVAAFDEANGRPLSDGWWKEQRAYSDFRYFVFRLWEWSKQKWWVLVTGASGYDVLQQVSKNEGLGQAADRTVLSDALDFLDASSDPVLLHLHLLGTHCCDFHSEGLSFTEEQAQVEGLPVPELKKRAAYMSSIRDFDRMSQNFVEQLRARGVLDKSILVFSSDHTVAWGTNERIPLMVRFPHAEHVGRVDSNVELLSLPASILRWLGMDETPEWMWSEPWPLPQEAQSDARDDKAIVSVSSIGRDAIPKSKRSFSFVDHLLGKFRIADPRSSSYGIGSITLIRCDSWSEFTVGSEQWTDGLVSEHTRPCDGEARWTPTEKDAWLTRVEEEYGVQLIE